MLNIGQIASSDLIYNIYIIYVHVSYVFLIQRRVLAIFETRMPLWRPKTVAPKKHFPIFIFFSCISPKNTLK